MRAEKWGNRCEALLTIKRPRAVAKLSVLAWGEQAPYHDNVLQKFQLRPVNPRCRTRGERFAR